MNPADEMATNSHAAGSDEKSDQQLRAILENLQRISPVEQDDLHSGIADRETSERRAIYSRLVAIEKEMKRRGSRTFTRYLVAILIGVAATLAWQFYGKRSSATETPVAQTAPAAVAPSAPVAPSIDPAEVHQIAMDLAALRQTVAQITAGQDQMARKVDRLQAADQEILAKMPEPPPPPPIAAGPLPGSAEPWRNRGRSGTAGDR